MAVCAFWLFSTSRRESGVVSPMPRLPEASRRMRSVLPPDANLMMLLGPSAMRTSAPEEPLAYMYALLAVNAPYALVVVDRMPNADVLPASFFACHSTYAPVPAVGFSRIADVTRFPDFTTCRGAEGKDVPMPML